MADARYVIDLILKAHDATSDAFQKIGGNLEGMQEKFAETDRATQESTDKMQRNLRDWQRQVETTNRAINREFQGNEAQLKKVVQAGQDVEKAYDNLGKKQQDLARIQAQNFRSEEERLLKQKQAITEANIAENELIKTLEKRSKLTKEQAINEAQAASSLANRKARMEEIAAATDRAAKAQKEYSQADDPQRRQQASRAIDQETDAMRRLGVTVKETTQLKKALHETGDIERHNRELDTVVRKMREFESAAERAKRAKQELNRETDKPTRFRVELEEGKARAEAFALKRELETLFRRQVLTVDADTGAATANLARFKAYASTVLNDIDVNVDVDTARAQAQLALLNRKLNETQRNGRGLLSVFGTVRSAFSDNFANMEGSVARFDNVMRGAFTLLITFFLPQLIVLAGAAGGALLALGSSAVFAAGAIGGSLVAGIGQALPALGVLVTAITRVKNVFDAVKQANLLQQQQSYQGAQQARRSANAENTLTNALEQQKQAHDNIAEAQDRVTDARENAKRAIEDLILAERRASLSVKEAEDALRDAIQSGQAGEIESRRLDLQEAQIRAQRAREDANEARRTGDPGGQIESAKKSLEDARVAAERAQRSVENARRSSEGAAAGVTAAAGKLEFLKSQMSEAELALFNALTTLQNKFRDFAKDVSTPLIESFTRTTRRFTELLSDRRILDAARGLSRAMAEEFDKATQTFGSGRALRQQIFLTKEASENMRLFGRFTRAAGQALLDIAVAASPAFRTLGRIIANAAESFQEFTSSRRGQRDMAEFFRDGLVHLRAWIGLLTSIVRLFAAIISPGGGAQTGLKLIRGMTEAINDFADSINTKGSDANKFFKDLFTVTLIVFKSLGPILKALGKELQSIFGEEAGNGGAAVKSFTTITTTVLIPLLGQFLRFMIAIGNAVGGFIALHPGISQLAITFGAMAVTAGVLGKAFALIFGPIKSIVGAVFQLNREFAIFSKIAQVGLRPLLMGGFIGAAVGAVVLLLAKYKQLDDVWRGFLRALRSLRAPFNQLIDAFKDLGKEFGISDKGLDGFLKTVAKIIRIGLVEYFKFLAIAVGNWIRILTLAVRVVAGVIRILRGLADVIIGIFTLDTDQMLSGFKRIGSGLVTIFSGVLDFFKGWISQIADLFGGLPDTVLQFGKDVAKSFVKGMSGLPGALFRALAGVIDGPLALGGVLARLIDKALPDKIALPGLPDVNLPDNPLKDVGAYAEGGAVSGPGGRDQVFARLTAGEHVWTTSEVAAAGGHGVMYALRSFFGGGGQARGRAFAEGGQVQGGRASSAESIATADLSNLIDIIDAAGDRMLAVWSRTWRRFNSITENGREKTAIEFRRMQVNIADRMDRAADIAIRRASRLRTGVLQHFEDMTRGVRRGLVYVSNNVSNALDTFGAKPQRIKVDTPPNLTAAATGGWIGRQGERGRDMIPTILGRGEAVLNWGQQKIVNSALWNQYGTTLDRVFATTRGYHAGGHGALGFATGGNVDGGPGHSGAGFTPVWNLAKSKFGMTYFTGFDGHNMMTSSGNISDHYRHMALDMGNGVLTRGEDALNNFIKGKLAPTVKQLIWRDKDQFSGFPIGGHQDHVHYAMHPQYAFNPVRMARIISRAMRGLSIDALLAGGSGALNVQHLDKIKTLGNSRLAGLTRRMLDKVVNAANNFIDKQAAKFTDADSTLKLGPGGAAEKIFDYFVGRGFTEEQAAAFVGNFVQESGLNPGAVQPGGPGRGLAQWGDGRFAALQAFAAQRGTGWQNMQTQLDFVWHELQTTESGAFRAIKAARTLQEAVAAIVYEYERAGIIGDRYGPASEALSRFGHHAQGGFVGQYAEGGVIPGGEGEPKPVLAHAGEWILNRVQQSKLASLTGIGTETLKRVLGFPGLAGIRQFQDGGEVDSAGSFLTRRERRQQIKEGEFNFPPFPLESFREIRRAFDQASRAMRNAASLAKTSITDRTDKFIDSLQQVTGENGVLDKLGNRIEQGVQRMQTNLTRSLFRVVRGPRGRIRDVRRTDNVSDEEAAQQAIDNQIITLNRLNDYRRRVVRILNQINRQDKRLRERIAKLRQGGITDEEEKEIAALQEDRQTLRSEKVGLKERLDTIKEQIAEQIQAIYDARTEQIQALAEGADRPVEIVDLKQRLAEALGQNIEGIISARIDAIKEQIETLKKAQAQAKKIGNTELANEIQTQIDDANASIVESQGELLQAIVDRIEEGSERVKTALDLRGRLADVRQGLGDAVGASQAREGIVGAERRNIINTRAALQNLLNAQLALPANKRNQEIVQHLNEQIADLNVQLEENTLAQRDATNATREAMLTEINRPAQFQTGVFGQLGNILGSIGNITGSDTSGQQKGVLQQIGDVLTTQGDALRNQLFAWLGIDLAGLSGTEFVQAIASLDFNALTQGMTEAERSTFENLINAIVENELAINQNTEAVGNLSTQLQPQDFASTAWQWFRQAIFTGSGGLLPQFQPPGLAEGGTVLRTGMALVHEGEWFMNPNSKTNTVPLTNGSGVEITINEAGGPVDVEHLASRMQWELKGRR